MGRLQFFFWVLLVVLIVAGLTITVGRHTNVGFWAVQSVGALSLLVLAGARLRNAGWRPVWLLVMAIPTVMAVLPGEVTPWLVVTGALPAGLILAVCFLAPESSDQRSGTDQGPS